MSYYKINYRSPLGQMLLAGEEHTLTGLWFEGQKYFARGLSNEAKTGETPALQQTEIWLDRYFSDERPAVSELPLAPAGSEFQRAVWQLLCEIPYGEVTTYSTLGRQVAARLGRDHMSAQAVGGAVGHNPISIVIPCHRVVGADGSLTGYAGGLQKKVALLTLEGVNMNSLYHPKKGSAL